jgi:predicted alpha/beta-hydrolase family hydrolase
MDSPFMERIAELLAAQGIAVARFEFPYMAQRREDGRGGFAKSGQTAGTRRTFRLPR